MALVRFDPSFLVAPASVGLCLGGSASRESAPLS